MKLLDNKTAVISGTNRGIGKSILELFAKNNCNIFACAREASEEFSDFMFSLSNEFNVVIEPIYFDFSNQNSIKDAAKTILSKTQKIDIIINNAGLAHGSLFQMLSYEKMYELFNINFFAQVQFTQLLVKNMIKNKSGSIVNIGSTSGLIGDKGTVGYGSSKAAFMYSSKAMASELGRYNIRVNSIAPGITKTDMSNQMDDNAVQKALSSISLSRLAKPSEIAEVALFLSSEMSSYISGQTIRVDGGLI
jgi:3-oxoacyl-[acyl-carrier protein] reductase